MMSQKKASLSFNNTPLIDVIYELEKTFDIKLSFNSELISNQMITFHGNAIFLEVFFKAIEGQTDLEFVKITNRYYSIKNQLQIDLSQTQNLDEVVISEYLTSGVKKKRDGSIILSPSSLGILPGLTEPDVLQSLQLLPGIQSPTETASGLYIRGGTPDQNLILWDGIKMYHSGHFFGMISAFNPYITKEVKLYTSGTRAKYGSRISSVIDITSSNTIPKHIEGGLGFNMTHTDAFLKIPLTDKVAVIASARRSFNDVLESVTFKNISKRVFQNTKISDGKNIFEEDDITQLKDLFYFSDISLKTIIKPNKKNRITISSLFTKNKLDFGFEIKEIMLKSRDILNIKNQGASILWEHNLGNPFSFHINAYHSNFNLNYLGEEFIDQIQKQNSVEDFGVSFDTNWNINKANKLSLGYQLSSNKIGFLFDYKDIDSNNPENTYTFEDSQNNNSHTLYTDYQFKIKNKIAVNLGLRSNYFSEFDKVFHEPRIYFQAGLSKNLSFKLSLEKIHQVVSQIVEFNTPGFELENQIWALADGEFIPILKSQQITSGFAYKKDGWKFDIDGYYKRINGLTSLTKGFDNQNSIDFFEGKSNILGLDILVKKKINSYRTWLSYSLINNEFTFSNINEGNPFPGNFDIRHHFSWSHSYLWKEFNFALGLNIRTGTPYTNATGLSITDDFIEINYSKTNGSRLSNYSRLDFSTTYKFNLSKNKNWKGKLGFSLLNITNKENILGRSYKIASTFDGEDVNYSLQEVNKYALGITPNLVFRISF